MRVGNLFVVATLQATVFTTIYLGGTFAVLGVNPITKLREYKADRLKQQELYARMADKEQNLQESLESMTYG